MPNKLLVTQNSLEPLVDNETEGTWIKIHARPTTFSTQEQDTQPVDMSLCPFLLTLCMFCVTVVILCVFVAVLRPRMINSQDSVVILCNFAVG